MESDPCRVTSITPSWLARARSRRVDEGDAMASPQELPALVNNDETLPLLAFARRQLHHHCGASDHLSLRDDQAPGGSGQGPRAGGERRAARQGMRPAVVFTGWLALWNRQRNQPTRFNLASAQTNIIALGTQRLEANQELLRLQGESGSEGIHSRQDRLICLNRGTATASSADRLVFTTEPLQTHPP